MHIIVRELKRRQGEIRLLDDKLGNFISMTMRIFFVFANLYAEQCAYLCMYTYALVEYLYTVDKTQLVQPP